MRLIDADELKDTLLRYNYTTAHNQIFRYIDEQPTAYDVDKVVEQLEERKQEYLDGFGLHKNNELYGVACGLGDAVEIVKQEAEQYNDVWIPCSERLPDYGERVLLQDFFGNITLEKCERKKKVKGFTDGNWWSSANNYIAWQPLPQPFQKGE